MLTRYLLHTVAKLQPSADPLKSGQDIVLNKDIPNWPCRRMDRLRHIAANCLRPTLSTSFAGDIEAASSARRGC